MKKLFLLIPALVLAIVTNAAVINVNPGNNTIRSAIYNSATSDGDVLVLADGTYTDDNYIDLIKSVEIKAADGAHPIIALNTYIKVYNGKHTTLRGLSFDGSAQGSRDQYFRFTDNGDNELEIINCTFTGVKKNIFRCESGNKFALLDVKNCTFAGSLSNVMKLESNLCGAAHFDGCEFSNTAEIVIYGLSTSHLDECVVNNCYFHDNAKQSIYFEASGTEGTETCDELTVTNSTFANTTALTNWISVIDIRPYAAVNAIKVTVDHCTFYNNPCVDSGHANIRTHDISDVAVSNSIFMHPTEIAQRATYCDGGGTVSNCVAYNYTKDPSNYAHAWGPTVTNCVIADPLFTDAANGDYTFAGNWVTPSISPARGAATDGSDLGDPRWYTDEVLPNVDFASPYVLDGLHAKLSGRIELDGDNFLKQNNNSDPTLHGKATWKIHATKSCYVSVTPDIKGGSGHHYQIAIYDANNTLICDPLAENDSWDGDITPNFGTILIPAAGDYKVVLSNLMNNSSATLRTITFAYVGGDVKAMPGTTDIDDAWFSSNGTRTAGEKIVIPAGYQHEGWVKWNVHFENAASYKVKVNINSGNGHNYTVGLYNGEDDPTPITWGEGGQTENTSPLDLGSKEVPAGDYILKVTNAVQYSDAELVSVQFIYEGGAVITLPGTLTLAEAVLSPLAYKEDGTNYIHFTDDEHVSQVPDQWAKWNVQAATGVYSFTFDITSPNYGKYVITVLDDQNNEVFTHEYDKEGDGSYTSPGIVLNGNYTVQMQNMQANSKGYITNIYATQDESIFVLDENQTDNGSIIALDGVKRKLKLMRSFTANKYYTLCIPIDSYDEELAGIFGAGYELWGISTAEQVGDEINLIFEQIAGDNFANSTPYIIKPTVNVENPTFSNHTFHVNNTTKERNAADFIGTFYKSEIPAGENNLYLQNNDLFYNETYNTPIKGTRAWIRLKPQGGANNVKAARIVLGGKVATEISLVNGEPVDGTVKTIENGQLVIIRDGVRYNVMGVKIQ